MKVWNIAEELSNGLHLDIDFKANSWYILPKSVEEEAVTHQQAKKKRTLPLRTLQFT